MPYTINRFSGAILATIADGTIDTTTDLTLVGKNYAGYGEIINENLVKLLENFSNSTAPATPLSGQLWYDSANGEIKIYSGSAFKRIGGATSQASTPTGQVLGDLWFDTTNSQLKIYDGAAFVLVGPNFTAGTGVTGAITATITDTLAATHTVVEMFVSDVIVAIISKDAVFTPSPAITGFATVSKGYNLNASLADIKYTGESSDATTLGGIAAANYLRSDVSDTMAGVLTISSDAGLIVGADSDFKVSVSGVDVTIANTSTDGDFIYTVADGGVTTEALRIDGATSRLTVAGDPTTALGVATKQYVDANPSDRLTSADTTETLILGNDKVLLPNVNNTFVLGSSSFKFLNVFSTTFTGTSTTAQYADSAERFETDMPYEPGTIVALGGIKEITKSVTDADNNVFGVISTNPGFMMNSNAGSDETHPYVAIAGRVPVKVIGEVKKGDRLVSAGNGYARKVNIGEANAFNVIGRALEDGSDIIEAVVTIN